MLGSFVPYHSLNKNKLALRNSIHYLTIFIFLCLLTNGCQTKGAHEEGDRLLARVYNKSLYLSDMDGMLPIGISSEDSSLIINKFVGNWVRETAMLHEAERNIPKGLDIDQLVENYRASLIKHNYENILVEKLLDSVVTRTELENFYEKNKEQYQLESPIIQCRFIKAPLNAPQLKQVEQWWNGKKDSDALALENWCNANAIIHHLNDSTWYKVVDIGAYMPQGSLTIDNVNNKKQFTQKDDEFVYMFELLDFISQKKIAPLAYIEDQARKVILHKRKTGLLEEMKDKLYDEALRKNSVSIYLQ